MTTTNISTTKLALALVVTLPLLPLSKTLREGWVRSALVVAIRVTGLRSKSQMLEAFMAAHGE